MGTYQLVRTRRLDLLDVRSISMDYELVVSGHELVYLDCFIVTGQILEQRSGIL